MVIMVVRGWRNVLDREQEYDKLKVLVVVHVVGYMEC